MPVRPVNEVDIERDQFFRHRSNSDPAVTTPVGKGLQGYSKFRRNSSPGAFNFQTHVIDLGFLEEPCDFGNVEECEAVFGHRASIRGSLLDSVCRSVTDEHPFHRLEAGQTGGVYAVPDPSASCASRVAILAVFKPQAEEGFERRGVPHGGGAIREEAVYMIDRSVGQVAMVPVTVRARLPAEALKERPQHMQETSHSTSQADVSEGAVQRFVSDLAGASEDFGMPHELEIAAQVVSIASAQHIASLDIRICNTDRHPGNLMFKRSQHEYDNYTSDGTPPRFLPIPIDHGCALPRFWAMGEATFGAWANWPQVHAQPLPEVLDKISETFTSRHEALQMLADLGLDPASQATYLIGVTLLYEGAIRHKLNLATIAALISRDPYDMENPSWLELQFEHCAESVGVPWGWETNTRGDRVVRAPADEAAWPPAGFLELLESVFRSDAARDAGESMAKKIA